MKYLQKLGKSLMLAVACLPAAGLLYGIGYWIDPTGWGANNIVAAFLIKAASAVIDYIPMLFAISVALGMSEKGDGASALSGLISYLTITKLLSVESVTLYTGQAAPAAFGKIENAFIGILSGIIASICYNRFHKTILPEWLSFFSGKRCVAIVTACLSIAVSAVLYFVWPLLFGGLTAFGKMISGLGAVGAGIYGASNRALIPFGLHHALNAVFWFDTAGINDLGNFWAGTGVTGVTGMYMTGFFPVTMFGLPAAALAMYHTAQTEQKKKVASLLLAGAVASFFTGITEPLEFSFMFLAPGLYIIHAGLTGVFSYICAMLPLRLGFNFSSGMIDWLLCFKAPHALNPLYVIPVGLVAALIYYVLFRVVILKFNLKTPGRSDEAEGAEGAEAKGNANESAKESSGDKSENGGIENERSESEKSGSEKSGSEKSGSEKSAKKKSGKNTDFGAMAKTILEGLGGKDNIQSISHCATRLRVEVKNMEKVDKEKIKSSGSPGVICPSDTSVQVVVGTKVQFAYEAIEELMA